MFRFLYFLYSKFCFSSDDFPQKVLSTLKSQHYTKKYIQNTSASNTSITRGVLPVKASNSSVTLAISYNNEEI